MEQYHNILVIKMSSLGDVIHSLPTLYALRQNYPHAKITWAVHPQFAPLLPGKPWIDEVITIEKKGLKSLSYLKELRKKLHSHHFDMTLDLQCIAKSAVVSFLSGAPKRYGYWELREGSFLVNKALVGSHKYGHVIERYLDTIRALGGTVDGLHFPLPTYPASWKNYEAQLGDKPYVLVAPGARWAVKEWPVENFASLCEKLVQAGKQVVLLGGKDDVEKGAFIEEQVPTVINLIGKTTMEDMIELICHCALFISADTGPLHIANACKKPLIALFGPTSPERTGPYGGDYVHIIVSPTSRATVKEPLIDDPECMKQISVDRVWQEIESL